MPWCLLSVLITLFSPSISLLYTSVYLIRNERFEVIGRWRKDSCDVPIGSDLHFEYQREKNSERPEKNCLPLLSHISASLSIYLIPQFSLSIPFVLSPAFTADVPFHASICNHLLLRFSLFSTTALFDSFTRIRESRYSHNILHSLSTGLFLMVTTSFKVSVVSRFSALG